MVTELLKLLADLSKKGIDFNDVPEINGVPVTEFNVDTLEDKPWKKPGKLLYINRSYLQA